MAEESLIEGEDENILYDLLVITEWPPETDTQVCETSILNIFNSVCRSFLRIYLEKRPPKNSLKAT